MTSVHPLASAADVAGMAVFDRAYLARFTLGNESLEREVLGLFAAQVPLYLERLTVAETSLAWKEAAHTLKGAAGGLGLQRLARLAAAAEKLEVFAVAAGDTAAAKAEAVRVLTAAADEALRAIGAPAR